MNERPKKNLWLSIALSAVAVWIVWQRLAPPTRPPVANAQQDGRVVVLFGEDAPTGLSAELARQLGFPVRDATRPAETTTAALDRLDEALTLKPNYVLVRLGLSDLEAGLPLDETLRDLGAVIDRATAAGAMVAYIAEPPPREVGDNWLMALRHLGDEKKILWITTQGGSAAAAQSTAQALKPFL